MSSSTHSYTSNTKCCHCGKFARVRVSGQPGSEGCRFQNCPDSLSNNGCNFFEWLDEPTKQSIATTNLANKMAKLKGEFSVLKGETMQLKAEMQLSSIRLGRMEERIATMEKKRNLTMCLVLLACIYVVHKWLGLGAS